MKAVTINTTTWTVPYIKEVLTTNDTALIRGMLRIFENQTEEEQDEETTKELNGVGFNGTDAEILSSFCKQYQQKGWLSEKQLAIARKKMPKYAGQLFQYIAYANA